MVDASVKSNYLTIPNAVLNHHFLVFVQLPEKRKNCKGDFLLRVEDN